MFTKPAEDRFLLLFRCIIHGPKRHGSVGGCILKGLTGTWQKSRNICIYIYDIYVIKYIYRERAIQFHQMFILYQHYYWRTLHVRLKSHLSMRRLIIELINNSMLEIHFRFEYVQRRFHEDAPDPRRKGFKSPETVLSLYSVTCWLSNWRFEILLACKFLAAVSVVYIGGVEPNVNTYNGPASHGNVQILLAQIETSSCVHDEFVWDHFSKQEKISWKQCPSISVQVEQQAESVYRCLLHYILSFLEHLCVGICYIANAYRWF